MKLYSSGILLVALIAGLVLSEDLEDLDETSDLETAESAFHIDPKALIFTGLAGIGALVVKGVGLGKLLFLAKLGSSHSSDSGWEKSSSSSSSYSSHPSYPVYKSHSSSAESSSSGGYSSSVKISGSVSSGSSETSSTKDSSPTKTSLSLDDGDDALPEN